MRRVAIAVIALILFVRSAAAAEEAAPPPLAVDPIVTAVAAEYQAGQLGQQHLAKALDALIQAYQREKARADAAEAKLKAPAPSPN